ncbi:hypothetical protein G114_15106 [Aeromonas diversa CDC 2478-85]|uniref:Uncharacterized protein n=1 Tax=Aeromonas diversa CDC 2478-85 TaxID=1268237 RepID=N9VI46_9GAMM|nr:hypothetical protein [Aeromonas diversa]ENY71071.1 hypothetical protein G114_15106 [Aeromonas diversa CDC 2478-85]
MPIPGVLSRLHAMPSPEQMQEQLTQCHETRAEALLLASPLPADQATQLAQSTLPLYCQEACEPPCRHLDPAEVAAQPGDATWAPEQALDDLLPWFEAGHCHFIAPATVVPVVRALLNIWPLDPHLARHFLREFTPLMQRRDETLLTEILTARRDAASPRAEWVQSYLKLERRLFRAHLDH